jgi:hypothetical protein
MTDLVPRIEALAHGVLGPLVLGGPMHLVPPLGPQLGLVIGTEGRRVADDSLRTEIDVARVRRARRLLPIDVLPELSPAEWAMVAALNDLLQATNQKLSSPLTRSRHKELVLATMRLVEAIPPPRTTLDVVVRHATFARLGELQRVDTTVRYWAGKQRFRGEAPPARLLAWPELRRVDVDKKSVRIAEMPEGIEELAAAPWHQALAALYEKSPITDLVDADRAAPAFTWGRSTLSLIAYPVGRTLARRALAFAATDEARARVRAAVASVRGPARALVSAFLTESAAA